MSCLVDKGGKGILSVLSPIFLRGGLHEEDRFLRAQPRRSSGRKDSLKELV